MDACVTFIFNLVASAKQNVSIRTHLNEIVLEKGRGERKKNVSRIEIRLRERFVPNDSHLSFNFFYIGCKRGRKQSIYMRMSRAVIVLIQNSQSAAREYDFGETVCRNNFSHSNRKVNGNFSMVINISSFGVVCYRVSIKGEKENVSAREADRAVSS